MVESAQPIEPGRHIQGSGATTSSKLAAENQLPPGLYIVSTPIGNLGDISDRARSVLQLADSVLCEDTRVSGRLLHHLDIDNRLHPYHEHNAASVRDSILAGLLRGESMVLMSDAGTPAIADPGYKLVKAARDAGVPVFSVPGPSAVVAALSISGLPTDRFFFQGFLPSRSSARRKVFAELAGIPGTLVCYESPKRLVAALDDVLAVLGDRPASVARELTKFHEEVLCGAISELRQVIGARATLRGEIVLMIGAADHERPRLTDQQVELALSEALIKHRPSQAAALVAEQTGLSRRQLYKRALLQKSS